MMQVQQSGHTANTAPPLPHHHDANSALVCHVAKSASWVGTEKSAWGVPCCKCNIARRLMLQSQRITIKCCTCNKYMSDDTKAAIVAIAAPWLGLLHLQHRYGTAFAT
jgi:hypothetical protein